MTEATRGREIEKAPDNFKDWIFGSGKPAFIIYGENNQKTRKRIRRLWTDGELPYIKIGSMFATKMEHLTAFIAAKQREMTKAAAAINHAND